ncbi:MAG: prepilin-type N-terminal cleavage/methylation domain-containing protein [Rhodospirillaceae bacterium]|nr:prepilin-type N-terminal cleavage/methylation domain-containing protein [Rhodospirillaceae bacterium]
MQRRPHQSSGFTLLEAIVALAVLGMMLIPIMSFMASATRQITAAAESNQRVAQQQSAMAVIAMLNPLVLPQGEAALSEGVVLRWTSTPLVDPNTEGYLGGRMGNFRVAFFTVNAEVYKDEKLWFDFSARKLGYQPMAVTITGVPVQ